MPEIKTLFSLIIILLKISSLHCNTTYIDYQDEPYDDTSTPPTTSTVPPVSSSSSPQPAVLSVPARIGAVFPVRRRFSKKIIPLRSSKTNAAAQLKRARKLNVRKGTINKQQFSHMYRQKPENFQIIKDTKQMQEPAIKSLEKELKTYSEEERQRDLNFGRIFSSEIRVDRVNHSYAPTVDYKRHLDPNLKRDLLVMDKNRLNITERSRENNLLDSIDRSKLNLSLMAKRLETNDGDKDMRKSNLELNKKPTTYDDDRELEKSNLILNKKVSGDDDKSLKNSEFGNRSRLTTSDYEEEYWSYEPIKTSNETTVPRNHTKSKILRNILPPNAAVKESNANQNVIGSDWDSDAATNANLTTTRPTTKTESTSAVFSTFPSDDYLEYTETVTVMLTGNTSVSGGVGNSLVTTESDDPAACGDGSPPDEAKNEANAILRAIQIASKETTTSTSTTMSSDDYSELLGCEANATADAIANNNTVKDTQVQATEQQKQQQTRETDEPNEPTEPTGESAAQPPSKEDVVAPKRVFAKKDRPDSILKLNKMRQKRPNNNTKTMKSFFF